ncbi:MAG TPA: hypothetical protein VH253_15340 [Phycisphaerae bacterium]|nr:hypothetical protein [Phycisphaerae bacterium]
MAETLEQFKKDFAAIKAKVSKYHEEIEKNERFVGQTSGVIDEGIKETGLRVQELKDEGHKGATIDAFMFDPGIKNMVTSIKQYLAGMQKELVKSAAMLQDVTKVRGDFQTLKTNVTNEIAKRKKELSTKAGTGNKSLPDMEKLLAEMKTYEDQNPYAKLDFWQPDKYDQHAKEAGEKMQKQVSQTKEHAMSTLQAQMMEQAMNVRVLHGNFNRAKGLYDTVLKECSDAQKALTAKNNKDLMTAKALIPKPWKDLQDINDMYQKGVQDQWIKARIQSSKDKGTIETTVKAILDMKTKAGAEVAKVANARLG